MRLRKLLTLMLAVATVAVVVPSQPASANTAHVIELEVPSMEIRDHEVRNDVYCRQHTAFQQYTTGHGSSYLGVRETNNFCGGEVRVEFHATGQLMDDDRICNIELRVELYEGTDEWTDDLDGRMTWRGGADRCLKPGGWFRWDDLFVGNGERRSYDHVQIPTLHIRHHGR